MDGDFVVISKLQGIQNFKREEEIRLRVRDEQHLGQSKYQILQNPRLVSKPSNKYLAESYDFDLAAIKQRMERQRQEHERSIGELQQELESLTGSTVNLEDRKVPRQVQAVRPAIEMIDLMKQSDIWTDIHHITRELRDKRNSILANIRHKIDKHLGFPHKVQIETPNRASGKRKAKPCNPYEGSSHKKLEFRRSSREQEPSECEYNLSKQECNDEIKPENMPQVNEIKQFPQSKLSPTKRNKRQATSKMFKSMMEVNCEPDETEEVNFAARRQYFQFGSMQTEEVETQRSHEMVINNSGDQQAVKMQLVRFADAATSMESLRSLEALYQQLRGQFETKREFVGRVLIQNSDQPIQKSMQKSSSTEEVLCHIRNKQIMFYGAEKRSLFKKIS